MRNELARAAQSGQLKRNDSQLAATTTATTAPEQSDKDKAPRTTLALTTASRKRPLPLHPPTLPTPTGNVMMAAAVRMVLALAGEFRGQRDGRVFATLCGTLVDLLGECPPLALESLVVTEAEGDIEATSGTSSSLEAQSFGRIADFARDLLRDGDARGAADLGERAQALSLLVAMAVSTGSVAALVDVAHRLLLSPPSSRSRLLPSVAVFLRRLAEERVPLGLGALETESLAGPDVPLQEASSSSSSSWLSAGPRALASDGAYLYLWSAPATLRKVM